MANPILNFQIDFTTWRRRVSKAISIWIDRLNCSHLKSSKNTNRVFWSAHLKSSTHELTGTKPRKSWTAARFNSPEELQTAHKNNFLFIQLKNITSNHQKSKAQLRPESLVPQGGLQIEIESISIYSTFKCTLFVSR